MNNLDTLASDIADRIIYKHCHNGAKRYLGQQLTDAILKRRRMHRPNWRARDRFLAPHERRFLAMLKGVWGEERRVILANMKRGPFKDMRKDSSFIDSWLYPKSKYEEMLKKKSSQALRNLLAESIPRIIGEYAFDVAFEVVNVRAMEWLNEYVIKLSANLEEVNVHDLKTALMEGIDAGEGMPKLRNRVNEIFDTYDRERAERIARTETIRTQEEGNQEVYKEAGFERKIWMANPDACNECEALNDKDVGIDEQFFDDDYGDGQAPPLHPNCVLPGTFCVAPGGIVAGYRSSYRGQAIKLTFANGAYLTVTPNHMFLTPHGFAAANLLHEGDDVFYCPQFQGEVSVNPDNDGKPALIEKIIETLAETRGMVTRRVPLSSEYLHGDGRFCDGDIDVIWPDGLLENGLNPIMLKPFGTNYFNTTYPKSAGLSSTGPLTLLLYRMSTTAGGSMGGFRQSHPFFRARISHADNHRLVLTSGCNSGLQETAANPIPINPESLGQGFLGDSGKIKLTDQAIGQSDAPLAKGNPRTKQPPADSVLADVKLPSEGHDGTPGLIKTTKLLHVETFPYGGHVYDLQTYTSLYICNGILSSNCRCASAPWREEWAE